MMQGDRSWQHNAVAKQGTAISQRAHTHREQAEACSVSVYSLPRCVFEEDHFIHQAAQC